MSTTEFNLSIRTPGNWLIVDADALGSEGAVDELVGDRLDAVPELASRRDDLVATVARTLARAKQEGILFTALLADISDAQQPVMANLAVGTSVAPPIDDDAEVVVVERRADGDDRAETADGSATQEGQDGSRREVDSLLMPAGPAIRVARLIDVPLTEDGPVLSVLTVQYFFTVPDADQMIVLSFTTPSLGVAEKLQQIFHAIAETVDFG